MRRERGAALIIAVLAVAVAVTAAVALNYETFINIRRTQNVLAVEQARQYALAAESLAIPLLAEDRDENDIDGPGDVWAEDLPGITLEDGARLELTIIDLQGRFNLNTLATPDSPTAGNEPAPAPGVSPADRFRRLLATVAPAYETGLTSAVADWLDADTDIRFPGGAEDDFYTRLDPPYRPGNTLMVDASELRLVRGMDRTTWRALEGLVTALPSRQSGLNVNTAPAAVLMSLAAGADEAAAEGALAEREETPWESVDAFLARHPAFAGDGIDPASLTVRSEYFAVRARVTLDRARLGLFSVIHRPAEGGLSVVYRRADGFP